MSAFFRNLGLGVLLMFSSLSAFEMCPFFGDVGLGYDYFRSLPEGDWEGNTGAFGSCNFAAPFYSFVPCQVLSVQLGASYGAYDFGGRLSSPASKQGASELQLFLTGAFFTKTMSDSGFNLGLAYDYMRAQKFGVFGVQNSLTQLRFQGGYSFCETNELGLWATLDLNTAHRSSEGTPLSFRALSQVNLFWTHLFENSAKTTIWAGSPYKKSLMFSTGRAGQFILGGSFEAPLMERLSLQGHACYMKAHSATGALKSRNYAANLCLEIHYAFGKVDKAFTPYMSLANNSNFLVDTNTNF